MTVACGGYCCWRRRGGQWRCECRVVVIVGRRGIVVGVEDVDTKLGLVTVVLGGDGPGLWAVGVAAAAVPAVPAVQIFRGTHGCCDFQARRPQSQKKPQAKSEKLTSRAVSV